MKDYSGESPDIALLLTVAQTLRALVEHSGGVWHTMAAPLAREHLRVLDDALKSFEHYPNPIETEETGARHG